MSRDIDLGQRPISKTTPRVSPGALRPHPKLLSALVGGLVATSFVTAMIYVGPALGLDPLDFAAMLGAVIVGGMAEPTIIGLLIHLINGSIIFPAIYVFPVYRMLPGPSWLRVWPGASHCGTVRPLCRNRKLNAYRLHVARSQHFPCDRRSQGCPGHSNPTLSS